jgi:hypothetical protein
MMRIVEERSYREVIKSKGVKPLVDMYPVTAIGERGGVRQIFLDYWKFL